MRPMRRSIVYRLSSIVWSEVAHLACCRLCNSARPAAAGLALARALRPGRRRARVLQPGPDAAARAPLRRAEADAAAALHRLPGSLHLPARLAGPAAAAGPGDRRRAHRRAGVPACPAPGRRAAGRAGRGAARRARLHSGGQRHRAADRDAVRVWAGDVLLAPAGGDGRRTLRQCSGRATDDERGQGAGRRAQVPRPKTQDPRPKTQDPSPRSQVPSNGVTRSPCHLVILSPRRGAGRPEPGGAGAAALGRAGAAAARRAVADAPTTDEPRPEESRRREGPGRRRRTTIDLRETGQVPPASSLRPPAPGAVVVGIVFCAGGRARGRALDPAQLPNLRRADPGRHDRGREPVARQQPGRQRAGRPARSRGGQAGALRARRRSRGASAPRYATRRGGDRVQPRLVFGQGVGRGEEVLRAAVLRRHARSAGDLGSAARGLAAAAARRWYVARAIARRNRGAVARADRRRTLRQCSGQATDDGRCRAAGRRSQVAER